MSQVLPEQGEVGHTVDRRINKVDSLRPVAPYIAQATSAQLQQNAGHAVGVFPDTGWSSSGTGSRLCTVKIFCSKFVATTDYSNCTFGRGNG